MRGPYRDHRANPMRFTVRLPAGLSGACPLALASCVPLAAQSVTVGIANVRYSMQRPAVNQAESPGADFTTHAAGAADVVVEDGWYYRIEGDPSNRALRDDGSLVIASVANHADVDWSNVDRRGLIALNLDVDAVSTGAVSGTVIHRMVVSNISTRPLTVHLLRFVDVDVAGTTNDVTGRRNRHSIASASSPERYEFFGAAVDRSCVATARSDECGIVLGTDLDGSAPPFRGDYSAAFQWTFENIPPNSLVDRVATSALSGNSTSCAWGFDVYGTDAPVSTGIITTEPEYRLPPLLGAGSAAIGTYRNWPAGVEMLWCLGVRRTDVDIGALGLRLHVDPLASGTLGGIPNEFALTFGGGIPNRPELCGLEVHFQLFALDSRAPNRIGGYAKPSTWVIGRIGQ